MTNQKPTTPPATTGRAVDDEDPNYSPMADKPEADAESSDAVKAEIDKDNDRISKGAP